MKHVGMMVLVPPERQENNTCPVFVIDREAGVSVVEKKRNRRESTEKVIHTYGGGHAPCVSSRWRWGVPRCWSIEATKSRPRTKFDAKAKHGTTRCRNL